MASRLLEGQYYPQRRFPTDWKYCHFCDKFTVNSLKLIFDDLEIIEVDKQSALCQHHFESLLLYGDLVEPAAHCCDHN